ncbi:Gfo/Idh/MocA family oxidoreductase [Allosphingosinicella flava]|uniref:Gfo/Idh/MocA family oxidoreductase n=1 Tax=Allosphingosinicella flava TaxID=2771430 RepID=A0A7T2GIN0_9SPHN|nr:Gfo/Idh/MocA family oxidoreductase [Sphingosinicella flava]QPQ54422.1 Gfo/Idh/MocA family oxidoreductase [Sphingosinicella flava]
MNFPYIPIRDRKIRFALVGCGRIAKNHFEAIAAHADDAELIDVCDTDEEALAAAVRATGAKGHGSIETLLASTSADVVILTTPSGLHPAHTIAAARSGRHVISEKPMATRWPDGLRMVRECDEAGVRLFVVKQNRRNATLQMLKRAVDAGRFGRIYLVALNVFWTRPQEYYDAAKWRGTWEFDGGAMMNQASHYIDLLNWLVGPVESVQAYSAALGRKIEAEDTAVASLRWRSGTLGSLSVTMLTYPQNLEGSITVLGEKGSVRIGGVAVNEVQHWNFAEPDPQDEMIHEASYHTTSVYGFGHPLYYRNVIDVLQGRDEPETDGRSGLQSLELLTALYRSARDGVRIALPLDRG